MKKYTLISFILLALMGCGITEPTDLEDYFLISGYVIDRTIGDSLVQGAVIELEPIIQQSTVSDVEGYYEFMISTGHKGTYVYIYATHPDGRKVDEFISALTASVSINLIFGE